MVTHTVEGGVFIRPLFFEFPEDPNATWDQENNIMIGSALKLSVLSNQIGVNTTDFYFPAGTWCNIYVT
jgi:alpha-glucosidase (family GH31 glycosyl hydrolase)